MNKEVINRLREFMDNEARSCSMDFGCITPEYVFRSWSVRDAIEEVPNAMSEVNRLM